MSTIDCEFCLCQEATVYMSFTSKTIANNRAAVCNNCFDSAKEQYAKMGKPGQVILMLVQGSTL